MNCLAVAPSAKTAILRIAGALGSSNLTVRSNQQLPLPQVGLKQDSGYLNNCESVVCESVVLLQDQPGLCDK